MVRTPIGFRLAHELEGLLRGIAADGVITPDEIQRLRSWLHRNEPHRNSRPFAELATRVDEALTDGQLEPDEIEDLLFVLAKFTTVNPFFNQLRGGLQVLMGLLAGVAADGELNAREVHALQDWVSDWQHLRTLWPFDECETIITRILAHNRLVEDARYLLALAAEYPVRGGPDDGAPASAPMMLSGICATDPDITFEGKAFVFTGESRHGHRSLLESEVARRGGVAWPRVVKDLNYLVVCDSGNELWAFSCYGRKVESAYNYRRAGHPVQIVAERDFWDATR